MAIGEQPILIKKVKKVKEEVAFSQDVKVGSTLLKAGRYQVASNATGDQLTFHRMVQDPTYNTIWNLDMKEKPASSNTGRGLEVAVSPAAFPPLTPPPAPPEPRRTARCATTTGHWPISRCTRPAGHMRT